MIIAGNFPIEAIGNKKPENKYEIISYIYELYSYILHATVIMFEMLARYPYELCLGLNIMWM